MASIWQRIKNFVKRFYPLTISRFNREIQEIKRLRQQELKEIKEIKKLKKQEIQEIKKLRKNVIIVENAIIRSMPKAELTFEFSLAEHCDLNCAGCSHFSPLAEPEFADYEESTRDFARLGALFHGYARQIRLMGGEPLLHPELIKFLKMARENFPDGDISIVTNGVRLLNQPEEFWQACKENRITIRPTKYPIPLDYEGMEKRADEYGVRYHYYNNSAVVKTLHHDKLDLMGLQKGTKSFLHCPQSNSCVYLRHGRLYTCPIVPSVRHFNKYFEVNLKEVPEDSIDIYQAGSAQEILAFLARPIPFCRYCMPDKTRTGLPWRQTERAMEEWT